MTAPFSSGERVLLVDARGRRFLVRLRAGDDFHFHGGVVPHDLIVGSREGTTVHSSMGVGLLALRPTMRDFVLKMPRGAQVVYPKDLGAVLVRADVGPGAAVLEAGTGSGSLTIALCRAVGEGGAVVSYEVREDFHRTAAANVEAFFGKLPLQLDLRLGDVRDVAASEDRFDRVVLDLPEPWAVLPALDRVLEPGGILCTYLPTTNQLQQCVLTLRAAGFIDVESVEVLERTWHVEERSVRPDHRMVAHTGFITVGRKSYAGR
jgi:tRNA (adenine57-N1/adenine58-N1)-methyltransferase catalytic subunit